MPPTGCQLPRVEASPPSQTSEHTMSTYFSSTKPRESSRQNCWNSFVKLPRVCLLIDQPSPLFVNAWCEADLEYGGDFCEDMMTLLVCIDYRASALYVWWKQFHNYDFANLPNLKLKLSPCPIVVHMSKSAPPTSTLPSGHSYSCIFEEKQISSLLKI